MNNADWEKHELECINYLQQNFGMDGHIQFKHLGGSDSTKSDIAVYKDGVFLFCMDAKMGSAQSGQFVLLPDETSKTFIFSHANKSNLNEQTCAIINEMNLYFDRYKSPTTKGISLNLSPMISANWIINHYKALRADFFITKGVNFIIAPIEKIGDYFDIEAIYRKKKSGSANPSQKDIVVITSLLEKQGFTFSNLCFMGKYLTIEVATNDKQFIVEGNEKDYYFKKQENGLYRITKLSNTNNPNVIFQISLKKQQDPDDLEQFKAMLR